MSEAEKINPHDLLQYIHGSLLANLLETQKYLNVFITRVEDANYQKPAVKLKNRVDRLVEYINAKSSK